MRNITIYITALMLLVSATPPPPQGDLLIITKTQGCNNFGGHNQQPVVDTLIARANTIGMSYTLIEDGDDYDNLSPGQFCIVALVYVSGDDVVDLPGEEQFFLNFGGTVISIHSGPDAERHPSITNCNATNASVYFAQSIIGASLRNGGCNQKHECKGDPEIIYKDPSQTTHPLAIGLPDSVQLDDIELYYVGPTISGTYWNPGNLVIWRAREDGPGTEDIPVMWETPQGHITLTLGHFSQISQPGEISWILFDRMWDYALQKPCTPISFPIIYQEPIQEPDAPEETPKGPYTILNMNSQTVREGEGIPDERGMPPGVYALYRNGNGQLIIIYD